MTTKRLFIIVHNNTITRNTEFFAYNDDILEEVRAMTKHIMEGIDTRNLVLSRTTVRVEHEGKLIRRYYFDPAGNDSWVFVSDTQLRNKNTNELKPYNVEDYWED